MRDRATMKKGLVVTYVTNDFYHKIRDEALLQKRTVSAFVRIVLEDWLLAKTKGESRGQAKKRKAI
jgi:hypothetical protein